MTNNNNNDDDDSQCKLTDMFVRTNFIYSDLIILSIMFNSCKKIVLFKAYCICLCDASL